MQIFEIVVVESEGRRNVESLQIVAAAGRTLLFKLLHKPGIHGRVDLDGAIEAVKAILELIAMRKSNSVGT